jgi:hypothetical protein
MFISFQNSVLSNNEEQALRPKVNIYHLLSGECFSAYMILIPNLKSGAERVKYSRIAGMGAFIYFLQTKHGLVVRDYPLEAQIKMFYEMLLESHEVEAQVFIDPYSHLRDQGVPLNIPGVGEISHEKYEVLLIEFREFLRPSP